MEARKLAPVLPGRAPSRAMQRNTPSTARPGPALARPCPARLSKLHPADKEGGPDKAPSLRPPARSGGGGASMFSRTPITRNTLQAFQARGAWLQHASRSRRGMLDHSPVLQQAGRANAHWVTTPRPFRPPAPSRRPSRRSAAAAAGAEQSETGNGNCGPAVAAPLHALLPQEEKEEDRKRGGM